MFFLYQQYNFEYVFRNVMKIYPVYQKWSAYVILHSIVRGK